MRFIARLDIKNEYVIKGINLEGLRKIGDPLTIAKEYYQKKVDEIIFIDNVASLYRRNNLFSIIEKSVKEIFIPITIGGGIRSLSDVEKCLESGADKIAINSYATENPKFINDVSKRFGASTIVSYIEAKKKFNNWEVYKYSGREPTGLQLDSWIKQVQELGCGEILLTSVDYEGMQKGFDIEMVSKIYDYVKVPLIISGGCGRTNHITDLIKDYNNCSVAIASALHYKKIDILKVKKNI